MKFIQFSIGDMIMIMAFGSPVVLAQFRNDKDGKFAYGLFRNGLSSYGGASLYDEDIGRYIVGTMEQLAEGIE